MNKFDERYEIRLGKYKDIESIMQFIDEHWKKNHIIAIDRNFFKYEFVDGENVNFCIAIDKVSHEIAGLIGFLYCSNPNRVDLKPDIWGSIWKVKEGHMPFLGIEISKRLETLTNCRMELGVGLNPKTAVPLREKIFKDCVAKMDHYYILNNQKEYHKLALINNKIINDNVNTSKVEVEEILSYKDLVNKVDLSILENKVPYKDVWYVNKRFFEHPYYCYKVFGIKENLQDKFKALIVFRENTNEEAKCLRIVDFYGQDKYFSYLNNFFVNIMLDKDYEYIDFYAYGFSKEMVLQAGFNEKQEDDGNIIPNYFEPYVQKNVDIWINHPKNISGVKLFKADADQDRPNFPRELREVN